MLLFNEKIINISLTKQKKNWLTCEVKVLQNFDASMLITKYYCLVRMWSHLMRITIFLTAYC